MRRFCRNVLVSAVGLMLAALSAAGPTWAAPKKPPGSPDPTSPCGATISKPSGGTWTCAFADDFSGKGLDADKWTPLTETRGTGWTDCRVSTPETIKVNRGILRLTVLDTGTPFVCSTVNGEYTTQYAAGGVSTGRKFSQAYGRFEIRAAMPDANVVGLHSAIWMWPQDRKYGAWSGEIDINEWRSGLPDRAVPTVHYADDGTAGPKTSWNCAIDQPDEFHTYVLEWTPTTLTFIYDGEVCLTHEWQPASPLAKPQPFDEPFFLILNQNLGVFANAYDPAVTPLPATMQVDYVRVWS